jgi:DNA-binding MarR family transcriptional regulator
MTARKPFPTGNAFLLAQLGALGTARFAARIDGAMDLTLAQAGLLRLVASGPGQNQHALAGQLGTPPSRLVLLVDSLEERGLIERRRNADDRRHHALHVTADGERLMAELARLGAEHEDAMCAPLDAAERRQLGGLLRRLADHHGLTPGVHPGFARPGD